MASPPPTVAPNPSPVTTPVEPPESTPIPRLSVPVMPPVHDARKHAFALRELAGGPCFAAGSCVARNIPIVEYYLKVIMEQHPGWPTLCAFCKGWAARRARHA